MGFFQTTKWRRANQAAALIALVHQKWAIVVCENHCICQKLLQQDTTLLWQIYILYYWQKASLKNLRLRQ